MLKDAVPAYFAGIYIVCGYTDLRYGIDSLAAIIERRYHMNLFVPNTLFLFCGRSASKIKWLLWEGDGFLLLYKRVESGHFTWPRSSADLKSMSAEQFHWLIRALQSNLSFMMSHRKVPVKRCFSLCNTENFFPVFRTVLFGLYTTSGDLLTMFTRSPKVSKALHSTSFFYFHLSFFPWESNLSAFHLWSFLPVPVFAELFFFPGFWYNGSS